MAGAHGGAVEVEETAALQDAVGDGRGQVVIVQDVAPGIQGLVGGDDHRGLLQVAPDAGSRCREEL